MIFSVVSRGDIRSRRTVYYLRRRGFVLKVQSFRCRSGVLRVPGGEGEHRVVERTGIDNRGATPGEISWYAARPLGINLHGQAENSG